MDTDPGPRQLNDLEVSGVFLIEDLEISAFRESPNPKPVP